MGIYDIFVHIYVFISVYMYVHIFIYITLYMQNVPCMCVKMSDLPLHDILQINMLQPDSGHVQTSINHQFRQIRNFFCSDMQICFGNRYHRSDSKV